MRYNFHQFHVLADILKRSLILSYSSLLSLKQSSNFLKTKKFYSGLVKTGLYQLFSKVIYDLVLPVEMLLVLVYKVGVDVTL